MRTKIIVQTDASDIAMGAVILQQGDNSQLQISNFSKFWWEFLDLAGVEQGLSSG